jgi:ATP-binding cassette subfamily B protein
MTAYIVTCCVLYVVKVLVTSFVYSGLFKENGNLPETFKQICSVWVLLCVLYVTKSRIETFLIPDLLSYFRSKLFANYIRNNEFKFNDTDVSSDVTKIMETTRNIRDVFMWCVATFIPTMLLMCMINIYFMVKYPSIGAINLLGNLISVKLITDSAPQLIKSSNERENEFIQMVGKLEENFNNMLNIYLNNKTEDTISDNKEIEESYNSSYRQQNKDLEWFSGKLKVNNYFFAFLSMYMLYKQTPRRDELVNGLLIFTFYLGTLENMSEDIPFSLMTLGNIQNIQDILSKKDPNHVRLNPVYHRISGNLTTPINGAVHFKDVWFRYENSDRYILKNFSLDVKPGDRVALMSQSGYGKTTSMKLLLGFYPPEKGSITIDGVNVAEYDVNYLRTRLNYVNQKTLLFHDTIINNMKYGNTKSSADIIKFLESYGLTSIFCDGTGGIDKCLSKIVEKNGTNISMGMQKVIFLVRGILKDDTMVYLFDEPLTSIDPPTRKKVLRMIDVETKGKTVIVITHDDEIKEMKNMKVIDLSKDI